MAFHKLTPDITIETYYMNTDQCKNYNQFHGYRDIDQDYVREGYYYGNFIGPFFSEKAAVLRAREDFNL
jgi:hypothetical protein